MIVLGADVGKSTGLALLDCSGARPRYLDTCVIRDDLVAVLDVRFFGRHQGLHEIAIVGIETPSQVFEHGRAAEDEGARRSIERALLVARDAAGQVRAVAGMRGAEVHDGQAHHVRRAVLGKLPRQHLDRFIAGRLPLLVEGWPKVSNTHQRDAAVVALWAWQRARAGIKPGDAPKSKTRGRPSALDLRDAAERAFAKGIAPIGGPLGLEQGLRAPPTRGRKAKSGLPAAWAVHETPGGIEARGLARDPGEERAACMLVDGSRCCGVALGEPCKETHGLRMPFGVHTKRALWAGHVLAVQAEQNVIAKGPRKLATVKPREAWLIVPWGRMCSWCDGRLQRDGEICERCAQVGLEPVRWLNEKGGPVLDKNGEPVFDRADPPAAVMMPVPEKHVATHGPICPACKGATIARLPVDGGGYSVVTCSACKGTGSGAIKMTRREWARGGVACWLYEPAET